MLAQSDLPTIDPATEQVAFVIEESASKLDGCAGWEIYGTFALLRSVAVRTSLRRTGVGQRIVREALKIIRATGVKEIFLLTENASEFFTQLGFKEVSRCSFPSEFEGSNQVSSGCCSNAKAMKISVPW